MLYPVCLARLFEASLGAYCHLGDEIASDGFPVKEIDDFLLEVDCKVRLAMEDVGNCS